MDKNATKLDWVGFDAAQYACKHWHYSRSMPVAPVSIGIWHDDEYEGAIVYGKGANRNLGTAFGLSMFQCVELCRVAMKPNHKTPVTRAVSISLKMLKKHSPGLRLIVSYADVDQGHHGGIYAGGNWVYIGMVQTGGGTAKCRLNGKVYHGRQVYSLYGRGSQRLDWLRAHVDPNAEHVWTLGKHKYLYPLDDDMRRQIEPLRKPYPKRLPANEAIQDAPGDQSGEGGASPTRSLLLDEVTDDGRAHSQSE